MPHNKQASLFIVATPIGNLKDITLRALEVLGGVDLIVSESVGKTRNLLGHFGLSTPVRSYRESNSRRVIPVILRALKEGRSVALVAEAGTPGVSDPGRDLVAAAYREGLRVVPVPGASAAIAALSAAGMSESRFVFEGFLPRRRSKRVRRLEELAADERLLVFFESPHRLAACLADMNAVLGDRHCLVAREITKMYEEMARGGLAGLSERFSRTKPLGEFVIVCEGAAGSAGNVVNGGKAGRAKTARRGEGAHGAVGEGRGNAPERAGTSDRSGMPGRQAMREEGMALVRRGMKKSEAAKRLAARYGLPRNEAYSLLN